MQLDGLEIPKALLSVVKLFRGDQMLRQVLWIICKEDFQEVILPKS